LGWDIERVFQAWKTQKELAIEQEELINEMLDVGILAEALGAMRNLSLIKLTSGGRGGPRRLSSRLGRDIFSPSPFTRTDGRQLISIFRAAAQASASGADQHAKVRTFIMDKDMWEGKYQEHRWLSGPYEAAPPDFGSLDPNVLTASLPIFGTVRTLELQAQRRKDEGLGPIIEQNLMALFKGMPDLEDLTLHNPMRLGPVSNGVPGLCFCLSLFLDCLLSLGSL